MSLGTMLLIVFCLALAVLGAWDSTRCRQCEERLHKAARQAKDRPGECHEHP